MGYNESHMWEEHKIIKIIEKVMPAVVTIVVAEKLEDFEKTLTPEMMADLPKGKDGKTLAIPEELIDIHGLVQVGGGSGFIVDPNGIIVTNKHVVSEAVGEYTVITDDGRKFAAEILTRDPLNDLAILKITAKHLPRLDLGDTSGLKLGQTVIAIGNALGLFKNTVSRGIVSGLSRSVTAQSEPGSPSQEMRGLIQTDAAINPGNSGGPLVDSHGRVIGINAAIISGAHSIGFAIPINAIKRDLRDLKKYGHIRRPLLGLRYVVIDEKLKEKTNLPVEYGALIMGETPHEKGIIPGSPAYEAGIAEHDIVLSINGERINRERTIQDCLEELAVGDVITLEVLRKEQRLSIRVTLAERR
jgi:serine protease Do